MTISALAYLSDSTYERIEHVASSKALSAVESKSILVQVGLQIFGADVVIDTANPVLGQTPESLNRIYMRITLNIDLRGVMNALMRIAETGQWIIGIRFVSEDCSSRQYSLAKIGKECFLLRIRDDLSYHAPAALDHTPHWLLITSERSMRVWLFLVSMFVFVPSAEETFVAFYLTRQIANFFVQHGANLFEHPPRAFIGDTDLALDLFCADSASRSRHQIDRIEPKFQGRGRVLEDRAAHRVLMVSAILAGIRWSVAFAMMFRDGFAFRAINPVWIEALNQYLKTSGIIWIFALEFHQRIQTFGSARTDRVVSINLAHTGNYGIFAYCRQGDTHLRAALLAGRGGSFSGRRRLGASAPGRPEI